MAVENIFERYGIKEVADVQFEALANSDDGTVKAGDVVLYLDTLKVSTIETTADNVEAKGGKGNTSLISWDYGKEVNVTLTDALFSPASLAVMMGASGVEATSTAKITIRYTQEVSSFSTTDTKWAQSPIQGDSTNKAYVHFIDMTTGKRGSIEVTSGMTKGTAMGTLTVVETDITINANDRVKFFYDVEAEGTKNTAYKITISADSFPGTYKIYGDTVVRSQSTGKDTPFQFVINKAKITSDTTLTMEAEGDPSTFDMNIKVLRDDDKNMFELIKYTLDSSTTGDTSTTPAG